MVFVNDRISDLLARIKNGYNAKLLRVVALNSKIVINILSLLQRLGYIRSFKVLNMQEVAVHLVYYRNQPGIRSINRISKLSNRVYMDAKSLRSRVSKASNSNGFFVLSTNKGVLVDIEASLLNVGGEVLFEVY
jgi:small subunit ribosomal protein S8